MKARRQALVEHRKLERAAPLRGRPEKEAPLMRGKLKQEERLRGKLVQEPLPQVPCQG